MNEDIKNISCSRPFSVKIYLFIVIICSWPFQFIYGLGGEAFKPVLLLSMIMVSVGTFVSGKYIFHDGFNNAGWTWGKPKHYAYAFILSLFLWLFPSIIEQQLGIYHPSQSANAGEILTAFLFSFVVTIIPAFGEEFGWRGYLLSRLFSKYSQRKALLLHGHITWIWHLPVLVILASRIEDNLLLTIPVILIISLVPTVMHAVVFAFIWDRSKSLAVATFYHAAFDEVRDSLQNSVGFGILGQYWQSLILTIFGSLILLKAQFIPQANCQKDINRNIKHLKYFLTNFEV
ncbi:MAG: CPBP family intramembrane metalloprotease [Ignavibacterium sp.]|jgi:membrane protease YdiL (CAAX protease family)|nr:CPBP family intramembrane metalloprotease [Ignavibacterium sp.]